MGKLRNFITPLHIQSKRNYLERMINKKVECMEIAKKYAFDYWDGDRKYGYGGYKYIPGRWLPVVKKIIKTYNLNDNSRILDLGCGKGFLLYEIKILLPKIKIIGVDISSYAIKHSPKKIRSSLIVHDIRKKIPFQNKYFDLVISTGVLHNIGIKDISFILREITRVGKFSYIMTESYRSDKELFNLQCWALTCKTFFHKKDWLYFFEISKFKGDYEFIYFS